MTATQRKPGCLWLAPCVGLLVLTGCGRQSPAPSSVEAFATVDGRPVPVQKLEAALARAQRRGGALDPQQVLESLLERERLVARALRLGLDREPEVQRAWESALIAKLKERELEPALHRPLHEPRLGARVGDPQGRRGEAGSMGSDAARETVRLAVLRLGLNPKAGAEKQRQVAARLEEARARTATLPAGTLGFGELALDYSDDPATRLRGGDLGWLEPDPSRYHLDPEVLAAGFALQTPGDLSPVVRGQDGFYVVRLIGRNREPAAMAANSATDEALARHREHLERRQAVEAAFLDEIRRATPVTVDTNRVARLLAAVPVAAPARSPFGE